MAWAANLFANILVAALFTENDRLRSDKNRASREFKARKKAQGICLRCTNPAVGREFCEEHLAARRLSIAKARPDGVCRCGAPARDGLKSCEKCAAYDRAVFASKNDPHPCKQCGAVVKKRGAPLCQPCAAAEVARKRFGPALTSEDWDALP